MKPFENISVFVTGGAQGIGLAIVKAFVDEGAKVVFCDIDRPAGELAARQSGATYYHVDVRDAAALRGALKAACERYGEIDILINNVGIGGFKPLTEMSVSDFDQIISTNLRPVFITGQYMAARRNTDELRSRYGRIINIASTRFLQSEPGGESYAASKGGVVSLTHALAASLGDYNITVNCISPGWIDNGKDGEISEADKRQHTSGRVGCGDDIARACLFLAARENDFINGQNIVIDGGMTKKMIYL